MPDTVLSYGPWRVVRPLGSGGMAEVYLAEHVTLRVALALKRITAPDPRLAAVLRREARAQAAVSHPNLLPIHDVGEDEQGPWMVMELAEGSLEAAQPRGWAAARAALRDVLDGLAHAHSRGLVHRDLKPANVLLVGGRAKIADFGLAHRVRLHESALTRAGTPAYMAPEQTRGAWRDFGPPTDLFAVGRMAIALLAGGSPSDPGAMEQALAAAPDGFAAWLRTATADDPAHRFRFAAHMRAALDALPEAAPVGSRPGARSDATLVVATDLPDEASTWSEAPAAPTRSAAPSSPPPLPTWRAPEGVWTVDEGEPTLAGVGASLAGLRDVGLIGREAERRQLGALLAEVAATRSPRLVLVRGPAGAGKTRLARWLAERAHALGLAHELGVSHGETPGPADALAGAASRQLGCLGLDRRATALRIARGAPWLDAHDQRALLAAIAPDPEQDGCSWSDMRGALRRWLRGLAGDLPLVVWLEDLQWGAESLGVVQPMLAEADCPVLFVGTVRDEALAQRPAERARLEELGDHPAIHLASLPDADLSLLAGTLLGLHLAAADRVAAWSEGRPLYAVEAVRALASGTHLVSGPDGYQLADDALPYGLAGVWGARLGAHAADPRVRLAAVLGTTFEVPVWAAACRAAGLEPDPALLDALSGAGLVRHPPAGLPAFAHATLRDAVLAGCGPEERATYESACADALAEMPGRAHRRGLHLLAAGRGEEGALALLEAGERNVRLGELSGARGDAALAGAVLGEHDARVLFLRAQIARYSGDWATSRRLALDALDRPVPDARTRVRSLVMAALAHHHDPETADGYYQSAIATAREAGEIRTGAFAAALRAVNLISRRVTPEEALATAEASLPLVRETERPTVLVIREVALMQLGRYAEAVAAAKETVAAARAAGMRVVEGPSWINRGVAHHLLGELAEAEAAYLQAGALEDALGMRAGRDSRVNLAVLQIDLGRDALARDGLREELRRMGPEQAVMRRNCLAFLTPAIVDDPAAWQETLDELEALGRTVSFRTPGAARLLELAGDRHPDALQAARAFGHARNEWDTLGRTADAERVAAKLAGLAP